MRIKETVINSDDVRIAAHEIIEAYGISFDAATEAARHIIETGTDFYMEVEA